MRTWRRSKLNQVCGSCRAWIREGDAFLEIRLASTTLRRCADCAPRMYDEPVPEVVPDDDTRETCSIAPQPSLGLEVQPAAAGVVSEDELARRQRANHFRQRRRG